MRTDQMQAFTQIAVAAFESDMAAHCLRLSPKRCEATGEGRLRTAIRAALARAGEHGWTFRGPVRLYIEMALLLGSDFATDPQYPWAADILADSTAETQLECAEQMFEKTRDHLKQVNGPDDSHRQAAARRMAALLQVMPDVSADGFLAAMRCELQLAHPEKARHVGEPALEALVRAAVVQARVEGLGTPRGAAVFAVLMFAFGHGCVDDPLVPWIRSSLSDEPAMDGAARLARLQARASAWLEESAAERGSDAST